LYHLLVYFRRKENRINLTFALTCLAVSFYDVSSAGLYNVTGVVEGTQWQRMQFIAAALITAAFLWFVFDYRGQNSKRILYIVWGLCVLVIIIQLVDRSGLTWNVDQPSIKDIVLPFGTITYYEATPGPVSILQDLMELAALAYVLWAGVRSYRRGDRAMLPLIGALGIFFVSVANDVAVGTGLYKFVYTVEYAYMSLILLMTYVLSNAIEQALSTAQQREHELAEAHRQTQQAAQAEQEARQREEGVTQYLRRAVQEYNAVLERVASGDYSARLVLDEAAPTHEGVGEMVKLGQRLNATIESLVAALRDLQAVQRQYVREAWESFTQTYTAPRGVRYHDMKVEPTDQAWLAPMTQAVQAKGVTVNESGMALPITLRGEVIGALGACRQEQAVWSDEDMALAETISGQLAQTIEGLRLLDETQRRAARERLAGEITARMHETLDVETVLRTALDEMYRALGLGEIVIRLATQESNSTPPANGQG
jgi:GAF domain-containing protein